MLAPTTLGGAWPVRTPRGRQSGVCADRGGLPNPPPRLRRPLPRRSDSPLSGLRHSSKECGDDAGSRDRDLRHDAGSPVSKTDDMLVADLDSSCVAETLRPESADVCDRLVGGRVDQVQRHPEAQHDLVDRGVLRSRGAVGVPCRHALETQAHQLL